MLRPVTEIEIKPLAPIASGMKATWRAANDNVRRCVRNGEFSSG